MNPKLKKLLVIQIKTTILLLSVVFFFVSSAVKVSAQRTFSKTYPASKDVRLELTNRTGTVTVEGWDRPEIRIFASMEAQAPAANIEPQSLSGKIYINLVKDNHGRNEIGYVNFTIKVPYSTSVNIETKMGNLNVSNVRGTYVRAHISTEGDVTLTNITADAVTAENGIGDIFFDGNIQREGSYSFKSTRGRINLRIPFDSSFRLVATAPSTRDISLGAFSGGNMNFVGNGRRVVGMIGDGSATLTVTNQRGSISFIRR